jgi:hypothetical protein
MIAIAAASHALDALYGAIRDLALPAQVAEKWRENPRSGPPRPRKLLEALKHGFSIPSGKWQAQFEDLFDLRDAAVHPETVFRATEPQTNSPETSWLGVSLTSHTRPGSSRRCAIRVRGRPISPSR